MRTKFVVSIVCYRTVAGNSILPITELGHRLMSIDGPTKEWVKEFAEEIAYSQFPRGQGWTRHTIIVEDAATL